MENKQIAEREAEVVIDKKELFLQIQGQQRLASETRHPPGERLYIIGSDRLACPCPWSRESSQGNLPFGGVDQWRDCNVICIDRWVIGRWDNYRVRICSPVDFRPLNPG